MVDREPPTHCTENADCRRGMLGVGLPVTRKVRNDPVGLNTRRQLFINQSFIVVRVLVDIILAFVLVIEHGLLQPCCLVFVWVIP